MAGNNECHYSQIRSIHEHLSSAAPQVPSRAARIIGIDFKYFRFLRTVCWSASYAAHVMLTMQQFCVYSVKDKRYCHDEDDDDGHDLMALGATKSIMMMIGLTLTIVYDYDDDDDDDTDRWWRRSLWYWWNLWWNILEWFYISNLHIVSYHICNFPRSGHTLTNRIYNEYIPPNGIQQIYYIINTAFCTNTCNFFISFSRLSITFCYCTNMTPNSSNRCYIVFNSQLLSSGELSQLLSVSKYVNWPWQVLMPKMTKITKRIEYLAAAMKYLSIFLTKFSKW